MDVRQYKTSQEGYADCMGYFDYWASTSKNEAPG